MGDENRHLTDEKPCAKYLASRGTSRVGIVREAPSQRSRVGMAVVHIVLFFTVLGMVLLFFLALFGKAKPR